MYHLFDRIYLDHDYFVDSSVNRITISETCGFPDIITADSPADTKVTHYWANSVQQLLADNGSERAFFDRCIEINNRLNGDKLVIYCDKAAFMHLFIAWHRLVLSAPQEQTIWKIFQFYLEKTSYLSAVTSTPAQVRFNELQVQNWDRVAFSNTYSTMSCRADNEFATKLLPGLSIEHLIASWVTRPEPATAAALKKKMLMFAARAMISELCEAKLHAVRNSQNLKLLKILGIREAASADTVLAAPQLSIFSDPALWDSNNTLVASSKHGSLRLSAITTSNIDSIIEAFKVIRRDLQDFPEDSINTSKIEWLRWVVANDITDGQLTSLLQHEDYCAAEMGDPAADDDKINVIFADWVLQMYRTGNTRQLVDLQIAV